MNDDAAAGVTATITAVGVLTVWGASGDPLVVDEGVPAAARNALINLLAALAADRGRPVPAAVRTPAGPWYLAVDPGGRCIPLDPADPAVAPLAAALPELDQATALAGREAVLAAAAAGPPQATLALASDPDPAVRALAQAELQTWADDAGVVAEAALPPGRLEVLARSPLAWVREGVASNPCTGPDALAGLVDDPDPAVRAALAARFDLDPAAAALLAGDRDELVLTALSRNPGAGWLAGTPSAVPVPAQPAGTAAAAGPAEPVHPSDMDTAGTADPVPAVGVDDGDTGPRRLARARPGGRGALPRRAAAAAAAAGVLALGGYAAAATWPSPATPSAVRTADWNGMQLPAGPDGPADPSAAVASGFARTELGAAAAAAHLSVRIDPRAGPASFAPTIAGQTVGGDPDALLAATRTAYDDLAAAAGVADGAPVPGARPVIAGWRTSGWNGDGGTVHLRVLPPGGGPASDYAIDVVWAQGDWALLDPADRFSTAPADPPDDYRSFP